MRFMFIRKADAETEAGIMPSEDLLRDMGNYNEQMVNAGIMRGGEGLHPSSKGAIVRFVDGKATVIDGPFSESKELIAGFTEIEVGSKDEALAWARRWPASDAHGNVRIEVRQVHDLEDFGDAISPDVVEREQQLRDRLSSQ